MDKARIKSAFSTIDSIEPEDILRVVLEDKNLPHERKAFMLDTASAKYKARARTQELGQNQEKIHPNYSQESSA